MPKKIQFSLNAVVRAWYLEPCILLFELNVELVVIWGGECEQTLLSLT